MSWGDVKMKGEKFWKYDLNSKVDRLVDKYRESVVATDT